MGYIPATDYISELEAIIGFSPAAGRAERWLNFAYFDVMGAVEFEELRALEAAGNTVIGTEVYAVPVDARQVTAVILGKNNYLQWADRTEILRRDRNTQGTPTHWTRIGVNVHLNPIPAAVVAVEMELKDTPIPLAGAGMSVLPDTWDQAIHLLHVAHAFMARAEEGRGAFWLNRAVQYIQTRASEEGRKLHEPGLALTLSASQQELIGKLQPQGR